MLGGGGGGSGGRVFSGGDNCSDKKIVRQIGAVSFLYAPIRNQ